MRDYKRRALLVGNTLNCHALLSVWCIEFIHVITYIQLRNPFGVLYDPLNTMKGTEIGM
jgi:hypothetical protein